MMGWGVAAVLLVERGLSWWQVSAIVVGGYVVEFVGTAFADGIKRGRKETADEDQRAHTVLASGRFPLREE